MIKGRIRKPEKIELRLDKKRFRVKQCPCGKSNKDGKFVPYEGFEDRGYCHSCQQTFLPNNNGACNTVVRCVYNTPVQEPTFIPFDVFKRSLTDYGNNNLVKFLIDQFGDVIAGQLISRYFIGTSKHWDGATVFWQVDKDSKIRTGKIMVYSPITGKRRKGHGNYTTWAHHVIELPEFTLKQCLFGEHLLKENLTKKVGLVESEKTAIISSVFMPDMIWIATGGKGNLKVENCEALKGRDIILYPDLGAYDQWVEKSKALSRIANVKVSKLLEDIATEDDRVNGLDIADYFLLQ